MITMLCIHERSQERVNGGVSKAPPRVEMAYSCGRIGSEQRGSAMSARFEKHIGITCSLIIVTIAASSGCGGKTIGSNPDGGRPAKDAGATDAGALPPGDAASTSSDGSVVCVPPASPEMPCVFCSDSYWHCFGDAVYPVCPQGTAVSSSCQNFCNPPSSCSGANTDVCLSCAKATGELFVCMRSPQPTDDQWRKLQLTYTCSQ